MQATKKSNTVITSTPDFVLGTLTFEVVGAGKFVLDVAALVGKAAYTALNDMGKRGVLHGFTQRISDRAAIGRDQTTGASATAGEKFAAMKSLADHLINGGGWELKGDGLKPLDRPALYQSVAAIRKMPAEKVEQVYRSKEDTVLRTLLTVPAIAAEYAKRTARGGEAANDILKELDAAK